MKTLEQVIEFVKKEMRKAKKRNNYYFNKPEKNDMMFYEAGKHDANYDILEFIEGED